MKFVQELSLKMKFHLLLLALFFFIVVMGVLWYKTSANAIEKNAVDYTNQIVKQVKLQLDSYFQNIQKTTFPILSDPLTQQFLGYTDNEPYPRYELTQEIERKVLTPILSNRENVHSLSIVSDKVMAVSSRNFVSAEQRYASYMSRIAAPGKYQIMGRETLLSGNVIAMALRFTDARTREASGLIIVDLNLHELVRICQSVKLGRTGFMWIADTNGNILYHPYEDRIDRQDWPVYDPELFGNPSEAKLIDSSEGKKLVLFHRSDSVNLVLVTEVPVRELNEQLVGFSRVSIIVIVIALALSLIIMGLVIHPLTSSLITLKGLMFRAARGDLNAKAPENKKNEIGSLFLSYNRMVSEIRQLIEVVQHARLKEKEMEVKQKESMLRYMQSQINPHFLYNTLEVVNSNAIVEGNFKISKMIVSLSEIFRYSVGSPADRVTLRQEVEHTRFYLAIQMERFGSLETEISLEEADIADVPAVRLMLQPIVENGFKHGYEKHLLKPLYIGITGRSTPEGYELTIADRGGGMDEETLNRYNRMFGGKEEQETDGREHIGMWNVHNRIRMTFGEPYGLRIVKSDRTGTVIAIRLPGSAAGEGGQ